MDDKKNEINSTHAASAPEARLGFMLYRAGLAVSRGFERALAPLEATPSETGVLSALAYSGPNHVRGLGRLLGIGRQTTVNVTRALIERQLICKSASPEDSRLVVYMISDSGRRVLEQCEVVARAFDQKLRDVVGPDNETLLLTSLRHVVAADFLAYED
jgi:DNA-binding MarR family transcriptional regulator